MQQLKLFDKGMVYDLKSSSVWVNNIDYCSSIGSPYSCEKMEQWHAFKVFFEWAISGLFLVYISLSKKHYNFYKKSPLSCLRYWDSNPGPSEHESRPKTTRPRANLINNVHL